MKVMGLRVTRNACRLYGLISNSYKSRHAILILIMYLSEVIYKSGSPNKSRTNALRAFIFSLF